MADASDFKPILSSSRMFSYVQGEDKDFDDKKVDDKYYNYMTSSYKTQDYLQDSLTFGITAPLIYQLDLLKVDVDSIHTHLSDSRFTDRIAQLGEVKINHGLYVEKKSEFNRSSQFNSNITASGHISSSLTSTASFGQLKLNGGTFTSASLAAGGGGTIDSTLKNGSTNAVQNDAIYDEFQTKLSLKGGTMTGLIQPIVQPVT